MTSRKVTIEGGDLAHLLGLREKRSEVWQFPDDIQRVVTLSKRHWDAYDWCKQNDWRDVDFGKDTFEVYERMYGRDHPHFNEWLLEGIGMAIEQCIRIANKRGKKVPNDNPLPD